MWELIINPQNSAARLITLPRCLYQFLLKTHQLSGTGQQIVVCYYTVAVAVVCLNVILGCFVKLGDNPSYMY